jgi:hypothetical protein
MLRSVVLMMSAIATLAAAQETSTGVRGVVRDAAGTAIPRVVVALTDAAGLSTVVVSGDDGSFAFSKVQPGTYSLIARAPGLVSDRYDKIVVESGRITAQNVQLKVDVSTVAGGLPIEIPICTGFPNGPSIVYDPAGWKIRMHPGDAPLPAADSATPKPAADSAAPKKDK